MVRLLNGIIYAVMKWGEEWVLFLVKKAGAILTSRALWVTFVVVTLFLDGNPTGDLYIVDRKYFL